MPQQQPSKPTVVGIGASAGGLKALKQLFSRLPGDSGLAYVVVVHLSPEHPSHLADLLQPSSQMPVVQVSESMPMEPNQVYVIPPGRNLSTIDTHLRLSDLEAFRRERAPIDHFFETLARTHGEQSIGIILSGTGSDGTLGLKKIKEGGGLTIVQEPNEAEYDGMPQSAIATQLVDLILPIDAMPNYILRFARTVPVVALPEAAEEMPDQDRQILQHIFAQLRARTGQDFSKYKRSTVLRRLRRRMQLQQKEALDEYLLLLRESPNEARLLADDFLITVTQFFRDKDSFDYLEEKILPDLLKNKNPGERVRVWSVGCATGEEAYSIAILLLEQAAARNHALELQVFASDLHEHSLQRAREGLYPDTIAADVSEERLKRFFVREDSSFRIRKDIREIVVFANHNLLKDPPFSHMDLIVCRNVLIYLRREAQHDVLDLFHYALNPDGVLMLGPSETVDRAGLFRVDSKRHSVFRRRNVPPPEPRLPIFFQPFRSQTGPLPDRQPAVQVPSYGALHQRVVERYALPSILVNDDHQVVHLSEHAGRYLQVAGGDLSPNLFRLAREELRLELRSALQAAADTGKPVRTKPIAMALDGEPRQVVVHVRPSQAQDLDGFYLVLFDEREDAETSEAGEGKPTGGADQSVELQSVKAQLRTVIEQYESTQEEMKAANEELQSTNEELRSAMEELETSKEELQSMNEELQTVNQENRHKVEELSQLTGDLNNLISATEIATLFLDQQLRILRVTPTATELFNVRSSDRGRPLTDFTNRLGYSDLAADAERVLARLVPVEREVQSQEGGVCYLMRILPYRAGDHIKGVVITFIEITERKRMELALRESEERFRALVNASSDVVYRMSPDWREMRELDGRGFLADTKKPTSVWLEEYILPEDQATVLAVIQDAIARKTTFELEHRVRRADGSLGWTLSRAVPILDDDGGITEWFGAASDITSRKQAEETLLEADQRKDRFLATLGHELRNPLSPLRTALELFGKLVPEQPELQRLRDMLERQVQTLTRLVDDLLDVARIKSGRVRLQLQHLDLRELVRDTLESMQPKFEQRQQQLVCEQPQEPLPLEGDGVRLKQVLTNLLDNACKYTRHGGRIEVTTRRAGADAIELSIRDNGVGIRPEMLERIFDVFTQSGSDDFEATEGLGLGLALVRQLVRLHGGRVEARSAGPGTGSEFVVRLPLALARREAPTTRGASAGHDTSGQAQRRVLVVDDNRDAADSLAMMLNLSGHSVHTVYDADDALQALADFRPEVILLDVGLPDMDGHKLARELRRRDESCDALIVVISGFGQEQDRVRSLAAGADHHLVKPVDSAELLKLIADGRP